MKWYEKRKKRIVFFKPRLAEVASYNWQCEAPNFATTEGIKPVSAERFFKPTRFYIERVLEPFSIV